MDYQIKKEVCIGGILPSRNEQNLLPNLFRHQFKFRFWAYPRFIEHPHKYSIHQFQHILLRFAVFQLWQNQIDFRIVFITRSNIDEWNSSWVMFKQNICQLLTESLILVFRIVEFVPRNCDSSKDRSSISQVLITRARVDA